MEELLHFTFVRMYAKTFTLNVWNNYKDTTLLSLMENLHHRTTQVVDNLVILDYTLMEGDYECMHSGNDVTFQNL